MKDKLYLKLHGSFLQKVSGDKYANATIKLADSFCPCINVEAVLQQACWSRAVILFDLLIERSLIPPANRAPLYRMQLL